MAVSRTSRHTPLLTVHIYIAGMEVKVIVDSGASPAVVGDKVAKKLGVWKRERKVKAKQGDRSHLSGGNFLINHWFQVFSSPGVSLGKFSLYAEVLDIGKKDVVLRLSWLNENGFVVDPMDRYLRNVSTGLVIPCSVQSIPNVSIINLEEEPLENG